MNKQLENFVQKNKEAFDIYEPSPKVWNAIHKNTVKPKIRPLTFVKYAAAILIFAVGFALGTNYSKWGSGEKLAKNSQQKFEEQAQLIESEYYYLTKINEKMVELEPFFAGDPQLEKDIQIDFKELDAFYKQLKSDLDDDINNKNVIEAMIQSYQMKLEILETLLQQLKPNDNEEIEYDV
ncbi:MAG: hypothetical protein PF517_16920 [Salinivirgaceae bacterium]|jgi:hypothetical protein|nr:hypothetical protein [Salinivirgaceae bacterium]